MGAEDALDYWALKEAILKRYDISEDTYKHRFRRTEKKEEESVSELVVRLNDVFRKWTRECDTVEQLADLMVMEQLLNTLPVNVKIWVEERRPKTSEEAARLADDYLRARKQTKLTKPAVPEDKTAEWNAQRCHTCKQTGHFARDCSQSSGRPERTAAKDEREAERSWSTTGG